MSREITIITPENVSVVYELSGIGSRFLAILIDTLIQLAGATFLILIAIFYWSASSEIEALKIIGFDRGHRGWVIGFSIFGIFLLNWAYFIFLEAAWNGQTIGKKAISIRVLREGGRPVDFTCSAIRNLMRYLDFLPAFYTVGLISIFFSPKYKRLGDYAAGTIVVKERRPKISSVKKTNGQDGSQNAFEISSLYTLSQDDIEAVRRFVSRKDDLPLQVQQELAQKIAEPLLTKLGFKELPPGKSFADFLEDIEVADRRRNRFQ